MESYILDEIDRDILMILQRGIPVVSRPYLAMAKEIGGDVSETDIITRIDRMKRENIIRRMSGFFDSRSLGYKSMLVAVIPKEGHFDEAVRFINQYPGVTHNYERSHKYSVWFTVIAINQETLNRILDEIENSGFVCKMLRFEMTERYKINVTFDVKHGKGEHKDESSHN